MSQVGVDGGRGGDVGIKISRWWWWWCSEGNISIIVCDKGEVRTGQVKRFQWMPLRGGKTCKKVMKKSCEKVCEMLQLYSQAICNGD